MQPFLKEHPGGKMILEKMRAKNAKFHLEDTSKHPD